MDLPGFGYIRSKASWKAFGRWPFGRTGEWSSTLPTETHRTLTMSITT